MLYFTISWNETEPRIDLRSCRCDCSAEKCESGPRSKVFSDCYLWQRDEQATGEVDDLRRANEKLVSTIDL